MPTLKKFKYSVYIARGWVHGDGSYDPDWLWESEYADVEDAFRNLTRNAQEITNRVRSQHGFILGCMRLGPRGGVKESTSERTLEHPTLQDALDKLRSRH